MVSLNKYLLDGAGAFHALQKETWLNDVKREQEPEAT